MSTAPAAGAATESGKTATPAAPPKITSVPKDVRQRILNGGKPPPPIDPAEKARLDKEAEDKKAAEAKAAEDKKAEETKAAADAAAKKKAKAPKLPDPPPPIETKETAPTLEQTVRALLPEITGKPTPPPPKFAPEVESEIKLAEFAETTGNANYAGMAQRVRDFYVQNEELLTAKARELGGRNSDGFKEFLESDEYRGFVDQTRPRYERGDKEKLKEAAIAARAKEDAKKEMEPKLRELELKQIEAEQRPIIHERVKEAIGIILADPAEKTEDRDPALETLNKVGMMKFAEEHPEEARVIAQEADHFARCVETVHRVAVGLEKPDFKANPTHGFIHEFMVRQNNAMMEKHPNGIRMADGKILVDAITYDKHRLKDNSNYRTWNADDITGMLAAEGNAQVRKKLIERREGVKKSIYAKVPALPPPDRNGQEPQDEPAAQSPEATTSRAVNTKKIAGKKESPTKKYR